MIDNEKNIPTLPMNKLFSEPKSSTIPPPVKPWIRLVARMIDIRIFSAPIPYLLTYLFPMPHWLFSILSFFAWVFVEPFFLSTWGTTFGKWLFNIRVTHNEGHLLCYSLAFKRSVLVWFQGCAMALPLISLGAQFFSRRYLLKQGTTHWDKACDSTVRYIKARKFRLLREIFITIASIIICISLQKYLVGDFFIKSKYF